MLSRSEVDKSSSVQSVSQNGCGFMMHILEQEKIQAVSEEVLNTFYLFGANTVSLHLSKALEVLKYSLVV